MRNIIAAALLIVLYPYAVAFTATHGLLDYLTQVISLSPAVADAIGGKGLLFMAAYLFFCLGVADVVSDFVGFFFRGANVGMVGLSDETIKKLQALFTR
ncbi:hypothetical protein [Herbaspirillum huttiense]|uniref:hypothetical protein n=1 Tax=Herbaspirillum huttiense TaxID=863372 RepID=UPI0039B0DB96